MMVNKLLGICLIGAVALLACSGRGHPPTDDEEIRHTLRHGKHADDRLVAVVDLARWFRQRKHLPASSDWGAGKIAPDVEPIVDDLILATCCDDDVQVRAAALTLLSELRPSRAKRVFVAAAVTESDDSLRGDAVFALDRYGDPAFLRPLLSLWDPILAPPRPAPAYAHVSDQDNLLRAFGRLSGRTEPLLRELLASEVKNVRLSALWALCAGDRATAADLMAEDQREVELSRFSSLLHHCSNRSVDEELYRMYQHEPTTPPRLSSR